MALPQHPRDHNQLPGNTLGEDYICIISNTNISYILQKGGKRTATPDTRACHFIEWIDNHISWNDQMPWDEMKMMEEEGRRTA